MDNTIFDCLSWKEILSLVDKYHKVNLLLIESDVVLSENYILPKSLCVCMIRYQGEDKKLGEAEHQENKARKKFQSSGRGTTALIAVLPRHGTTGLYYRTYYREDNKKYGSGYGSSRGTTAPAVLPRQSRYYRAACAQNRVYGPCIRVWTPLDYNYKYPYEFLG